MLKSPIIFRPDSSMKYLKKIIFPFVGIIILANLTSYSFAEPSSPIDCLSKENISTHFCNDAFETRIKKEQQTELNPFLIAFHKPTYLLPYYYTGSPYNSVYANNTPNNEALDHEEIKYQLSFKVPLWKNIFHRNSTLFLAYSQMSYWQAYNKSAFFRETDYEPEVFLANEVHLPLIRNWEMNFVTFGAVHQSNGQGGELERSWNRLYALILISRGNWMFGIKPWYIFQDSTYIRQNPNMASYMGHGSILITYKYYNQVLSLEARNLIEGGGNRMGSTFSWSFPLTSYLKGYVQIFSGYGQSLIEYNHRTNSIGVGIALSDWL